MLGLATLLVADVEGRADAVMGGDPREGHRENCARRTAPRSPNALPRYGTRTRPTSAICLILVLIYPFINACTWLPTSLAARPSRSTDFSTPNSVRGRVQWDDQCNVATKGAAGE